MNEMVSTNYSSEYIESLKDRFFGLVDKTEEEIIELLKLNKDRKIDEYENTYMPLYNRDLKTKFSPLKKEKIIKDRAINLMKTGKFCSMDWAYERSKEMMMPTRKYTKYSVIAQYLFDKIGTNPNVENLNISTNREGGHSWYLFFYYNGIKYAIKISDHLVFGDPHFSRDGVPIIKTIIIDYENNSFFELDGKYISNLIYLYDNRSQALDHIKEDVFCKSEIGLKSFVRNLNIDSIKSEFYDYIISCYWGMKESNIKNNYEFIYLGGSFDCAIDLLKKTKGKEEITIKLKYFDGLEMLDVLKSIPSNRKIIIYLNHSDFLSDDFKSLLDFDNVKINQLDIDLKYFNVSYLDKFLDIFSKLDNNLEILTLRYSPYSRDLNDDDLLKIIKLLPSDLLFLNLESFSLGYKEGNFLSEIAKNLSLGLNKLELCNNCLSNLKEQDLVKLLSSLPNNLQELNITCDKIASPLLELIKNKSFGSCRNEILDNFKEE